MYYNGITYPDLCNGLGCRVVLWTSGCKHNCTGCHNPETHNFKFGNKYTQETEDRLIELLKPEYIDGITLSGGDPMFSADVIEGLVLKIREVYGNSKNIWLYTGFKLEDLLDKYEWIKEVDYVVDGKFEKDKKDRDLAFRGSSNQIIWEKHNDSFVKSDMN